METLDWFRAKVASVEEIPNNQHKTLEHYVYAYYLQKKGLDSRFYHLLTPGFLYSPVKEDGLKEIPLNLEHSNLDELPDMEVPEITLLNPHFAWSYDDSIEFITTPYYYTPRLDLDTKYLHLRLHYDNLYPVGQVKEDWSTALKLSKKVWNRRGRLISIKRFLSPLLEELPIHLILGRSWEHCLYWGDRDSQYWLYFREDTLIVNYPRIFNNIINSDIPESVQYDVELLRGYYDYFDTILRLKWVIKKGDYWSTLLGLYKGGYLYLFTDTVKLINIRKKVEDGLEIMSQEKDPIHITTPSTLDSIKLIFFGLSKDSRLIVEETYSFPLSLNS